MNGLEKRVKALIPEQAKDLGKGVIRAYGQSTAALRPMPDFLVLGTKRGGSTSAWRWIEQHPQVLPMVARWEHHKSPHYFYWHYARGEAWYRGHFPTAAARKAAERRLGKRVVTGEASPYYMFNPYVPQRVATDLPDARFVVLLRDPVKRAYSHYWERVDEGVEPLTFEEALAAEPSRLAGEAEKMAADPYYYSRPHDYHTYRERGVYAPQLERWFDAVGRERVLVVVSEEMYADPVPVMNTVFEHLGIDPWPVPKEAHFNNRPAPKIDPATAEELRAFYAPHNAALATLLGRELPWSS
ncbi:MAG: sulfotransferase [Actinobacteria bacterium]|nr:sulfotransferase [Actinomycetota bacterium]